MDTTYRDKEVVGVFVRFSLMRHQACVDLLQLQTQVQRHIHHAAFT
jgi:hypothetical protein